MISPRPHKKLQIKLETHQTAPELERSVAQLLQAKLFVGGWPGRLRTKMAPEAGILGAWWLGLRPELYTPKSVAALSHGLEGR